VPGRPGHVFAGAAGGGVWRTTDDGRTWHPVSDGLPTLTTGAVAVDPRRPDVVWVGTGEANEQSTRVGHGVFRSTDFGRTWRSADGDAPFPGCATADLVVIPGAVLAAVLAASPVNDTAAADGRCAQPGVWRTGDDGRRWRRVVSGHVTDLASSPGGAVYAVGAGEVAALRSDDGGVTWTSLDVGLPPAVAVRRAVVDVVHGAQDAVVAAFVSQTGSLVGTWVSPDGGASWRPVPSTASPCSFGGGLAVTGQCWYDVTLLAEDETSYLLGGVQLQRFDARTGEATTLGTGALHVDQHALVRDERGRVWLGNDGGVYRSGDRGGTWVSLNRGLRITQFNNGAAALPDGSLLGGTQDNGTLLREADGWTGVLGADGGAAVTWAGEEDLALGSMQELRVWRTRDGGLTWIPADTGLPPGEPRAFYAPLVGDPARPGTAYAGTVRVHRTVDAGDSWTPFSPPFESTVTAIAVAPSDPLTVYAGTARGVRVTRDGGLTWSAPDPRQVVGPTTSLMVDPTAAGRAWRTVGGYGRPHVLRTDDGGATWSTVGRGLPDVPAHDTLLLPRSGELLVGTDGGVFRLAGTTWVSEHRGMPLAAVTDLVLTAPRTLTALTYGRSTFSTPLP
jgi:hypothetical protein